MKEIRTRFAPSPTGFMHIGGLRTALYSYAFARSQNGKFILRIEDTDRKRFIAGTTEKIFDLLKTFGLLWDEGPFIQSERVKERIYQKFADKLVTDGHAYYCFCPIEEIDNEDDEKKDIKLRDKCRDLDPHEAIERIKNGEKAAIRLKVPENEKVSYFDFVINKEISWESKFIDEAMLLKSDGFPTYHLAVVIDDALMKISHILRGHDWLPSTPVHLLLFKYLNFEIPQIGHLTDILDPEGGKLSKRKGSVSCEEFLAEGYLPEAILNFIMLLGWAPKDNRELFSLKEFVEYFSKGSLQIANPVFNRKKLDWFNGQYIRAKTDEEFLELIKPFVPKEADEDTLKKIVPLIKDRMTKLSEFSSFAGFFFEKPEIDKNLFVEDSTEHLIEAKRVLGVLDDWNIGRINEELQRLVAEKGWKTGDFFMNLRVAISGSKFTPPITDSMAILGKEKTLERL
jgi:nondiscriminating glutamyl-tRNA synthetase